MKKIIFSSVTLLLFLASCQEDLKVDLPGAKDKIVIEGSIENGKYAEVMITKNVPLFSTITGSTLTDYIVLDATVYVSDGSMTDTLTLAIDSASSLGLVYQGHSIMGAVGQNYFLTAVIAGVTYTSVTSIPTPIPLDSVWWEHQEPEDSLGYAWAHLSDPVGAGNNYRWFAKRAGGLDRRFIAPYGATFDDKFVDGKSFDFAYSKGYDPTDVSNTPDHEVEGEIGYYKPHDRIIIKFCTIDKASKDFYTTFEAALSNNGNPFASPVTVLTNINGGALGVWCGYGVTYDTIPAQW